MTTRAHPAAHLCLRCATNLACRHLGDERICDACTTDEERDEIASLPAWQKEDE